MTVRNLAIEVAGHTVVLCVSGDCCLELHLFDGHVYKYAMRTSSAAAIGACLMAHIAKREPDGVMAIPNMYNYEIEKFTKFVNFVLKHS